MLLDEILIHQERNPPPKKTQSTRNKKLIAFGTIRKRFLTILWCKQLTFDITESFPIPPSALFKEIHNIPSIPKVIQDLINDFGSEQSNAEDISKKIQMDPSISLKVMRLANSARYGAGRKINSIDSAIVLLGIDALKTLVISSGVTAACNDVPGVDKKQFWRNSFTVANISKLVGRLSGLNPEVAFTYGMLHNIGDVLLYIAHSEKMSRIDSLVEDGADKAELQTNQFGYNYMIVGAELAHKWNFPDEIISAIRHQKTPEEAGTENLYAYVLNIASNLYQQFEQEKTKEEILSQFPTDKATLLNLDLLELFEKLVEMYDSEDDIEAFLE